MANVSSCLKLLSIFLAGQSSFASQGTGHVRRPSGLALEPLAENVDTDAIHYNSGTHTPSIHERVLLDTTHQQWLAQHENTKRNLATETIIVPVAITVLVNSTSVKIPSNGWMSDAVRAQVILTLNYGFRDSPFDFRLFQIQHIYDLDYFDCDPAHEQAFKAAHRVARTDVLNVYYCNTLGADASMLGFAYSPARMTTNPNDDGVVVINPALLAHGEAGYQTIIHETGHFLGLLHTWQDGCSPQLSYKDSFGGVGYNYVMGDGVSDTPAHAGPSWSVKEGRATCWQDVVLDTCDTAVEIATPGIDVGPDPVNNYMNDAPARCYEEFGYFTAGQITRMVSQWETWRATNVALPTMAPSSIINRTVCRKKKEKCRRRSQCCGTLQCVKLVAGKKGTCQRCRKPAKRCTVDSHCCSNKCRSGKCE